MTTDYVRDRYLTDARFYMLVHALVSLLEDGFREADIVEAIDLAGKIEKNKREARP